MKNTFILLTLLLLLSSCAPSPTQQMDLIGTQVAAAQDLQYSSLALTTTAQAPLDILTAQSGSITLEAAHALSTTEAGQITSTVAVLQTQAAYTPTPVPTLTPVPTATQNLPATIAVHEFEVQVQKDQQAAKRLEVTNMILAGAPYVVGFIMLIGVLMFVIVLASKTAIMVNPVDDKGKPLPMINTVNNVAWDISRSVNGVIITKPEMLKQLPVVTDVRQDAVTRLAQLTEMRTHMAARLPRQNNGERPQLPAPAGIPSNQLEAQTLALPGWELLDSWNGESRPLGLGLRGIITAQAASPHLLISGKTGSGKTVFMLRTQATASLAKGYLVINLGYSDAGFGVFQSHPNYHSIKLNEPRDIIECLESVYAELRERKSLIGGEMIEWERWPTGAPPRPFIDIFMDELGNMAEDIFVQDGPAVNKEMWGVVSRIANEGRKVGIRFVAALQDPTAKSMDLRFRRNCTLVSFQQGDASQSSAFLGATGAENLQIGHFMARTDGLIIGGGFSPNDNEISDYLARHRSTPAAPPKWIEGRLVPAKQIAPAPNMESLADTYKNAPFIVPVDNGSDNKDSQILQLANQMDERGKKLSVSAIVRMVYNVTGGGAYPELAEHVKNLIATSSSNETAQMTPNSA